MTEDEGAFKCYIADTGLLVSHAFSDGPDVRAVYRDLQLGRVSMNKGMIVENAPGVDARKYGKQWVVTREAMSREYGDPATA